MKNPAIFVAAFLLYLVFAGGLGGEQLAAGCVLASAAVVSGAVIRRVGDRPIAFSRAHAAPWLRSLAKLPGDTLRVGAVLLRVAITGGSAGRGIVTPFRFGEIGDARQRGRRATAVIAGSLTPDTIVLHVAPGRHAICHRLLATSPPDRPEWLA